MLHWFVNSSTDTYNSLKFTSLGFQSKYLNIPSYIYFFFSAWFNISNSTEMFITINSRPWVLDDKVAKNQQSSNSNFQINNAGMQLKCIYSQRRELS